MIVTFTNTDSTGAPVTGELAVTLAEIGDGGVPVIKRHTVSVAGTGTARVPSHVGEHLVESPDYAVERYKRTEDTETD